MNSVSTFGAFTTARLGIFAAQKGLDVVGHNITNINTVGYTRQSLNQISLRVGGYDRYQPQNNAIVGSGVLCTGVSQLRDPYLDIRFRT
ncbi:MAG: flagellar basal body protein, partial [Pygmaiobacter massiliensis]|nr:flagellar basal body protein [Pygmaiobacter massiliensis]